MMPHTDWFWDLLGEQRGHEASPQELGVSDDVGVPADDPAYFALKLKRKNQTNMLKRMLVDAGYGDLASKTTIGRVSAEDY